MNRFLLFHTTVSYCNSAALHLQRGQQKTLKLSTIPVTTGYWPMLMV